ncbi:MAG TPA: right-handed parallel beta-helix repeat-containing protein [Nitrososphaeraceae archaeon]
MFITGEVQAQTAESEYDGYGYNNYDDNNNYNSAEYYPSSYESYDDYMQKDLLADIIVPIDFPTIQSAIDAADEGDVIKVLSGTYTEQITISKSLTIIGSTAKSTIIEAPTEGLGANLIGRPYIIDINNEAEVTLKGFTIANPASVSCGEIIAISVLDGGSINLKSAAFRGCTSDTIYIGQASNGRGGPQVGHATITDTYITDYLYRGVHALGSGSTLIMSYNDIIGSELNIDWAGGGIFLRNGAQGTITHNIVAGNICNNPVCGPKLIGQNQDGGIAIISADEGSVISNNYLSNNDWGIGVIGGSECCILDHNKLTDNRFLGVGIQDSEHTVSNTKIFGGNVGVAAIATNANTTATLDHVKIVNADISVQALSSSGFTAAVNVIS